MTVDYREDEYLPRYEKEELNTRPNRSASKSIIFYTSLVVLLYYMVDVCDRTVAQWSSVEKTPIEPSLLETTFLAALKSENLAGEWSEKYTSIPHLAGQGLELVNFTAEKFEEYGLQAEIETFDVLLNYPVANGLSLLGKDSSQSFNLTEDVLEDDPTTGGDDLVPSFHGYSASGNVTGEFIYANYGTKEDFEKLVALGVDFSNKIVIVRYGGIFRGLKVKFAQEVGAIGVLIYSDPGDDYYQVANGDTAYPEGPARNPSALQRGSVQFLSEVPGDPTTPGTPSKGDNVKRVVPSTIPKIPSLPVSYRDIEPILAKLNGHGFNSSVLGENWVGGLEKYDYSSGPSSEFTVNLYNNQSYAIRPIYNVYGTLKGKSDEVIFVGNHRDSWIKGGSADPNSGSATMLEIIRALHELTKTGWVPERTIKFASWDGEEYGLLGSTEFGETYAKSLQKDVVVYLNMDVAVSGSRLKLQASPLLNKILKDTLPLVEYPLGGTLEDHWGTREIGILGSGSDYTVFLEHLGITSLDFGFSNTAKDPVYHYHSNYDSHHWMSTLADPGFKFHSTAAQYLGLVILKISETKIIPFRLTDYASSLERYFGQLVPRIPEEWLDKPLHCHGSLRELVAKTNKTLAKFVSTAASHDTKVLQTLAEWENPDTPYWKKLSLKWKIFGLNKGLQYFERGFLHRRGLKNRPWFKHIVYAAGRNTGYEGFSLPGLVESLEDGDYEECVKWVKIIKRTIRKLGSKF